MKKIIPVIVVVAVLLLSAKVFAERITPSKNYVTKKVEVGSFDGISTGTSIDVIYTQTSGKQNIEIYASDNLINYINVYVEEGILVARFKSPQNNFSISGSGKMEVRVSAPAVHSLKASSSGDIILKNGLKTSGDVKMKVSSSGDIAGENISCDQLTANASSSGDITIGKLTCKDLYASASSSGDVTIKNISSNNVSANVSSSGDMILTGSCQNADYKASSSGDLEAKNLKAVNVKASASSSGDISCYASGTLTASASSSGDVAYKGNPKQIERSSKKGIHPID